MILLRSYKNTAAKVINVSFCSHFSYLFETIKDKVTSSDPKQECNPMKLKRQILLVNKH